MSTTPSPGGQTTAVDPRPTLITAGTGKTGRRVADRLHAAGLPVRIGSRRPLQNQPPFDWQDPATWEPALAGVGSVYLTYYPDLALPGAVDDIRLFCDLAAEQGVRRLVLLSGRGEVEAERCEGVVQGTGLQWTVLRANWFAQNFGESYFRNGIVEGVLRLPVGDVPEPFVDAEDIADAAAEVLQSDRHVGQVYVLSGPSSLTFREAVAEIAAATGRDIRFEQVGLEPWVASLHSAGVVPEVVDLLRYLFTEVLDGRNSSVTDGVRRAIGRDPGSFTDYALRAAAAGAWTA